MLLRAILWLNVLVMASLAVEMNDTRSWKTKRLIVDYHNNYRSKVQPTASNMLFMHWHPEAARQAQRYAEQCQFMKHNDPSEKTVTLLGSCGQNLFASYHKTTWSDALNSWYSEHKNFKYGDSNVELHIVGHYTQMVWATSHRIGCGMAFCSGGPWGQFYNYVCHYCPTGNYGSALPFPYKRGTPCADCPNDCIGGTLCNNACSRVDKYSNCAELVSKVSGYCQHRTCNATCECGNKRIHQNFPF